MAHTIETSLTHPFVFHFLCPVSTQSEPSRTARVVMLDGSEPGPGSVSAKQPIASPRAIRGNHSSRWASLPYVRIGNMASEPCTLTNERSPESPYSTSRLATPYSTALAPAQPYPSRCMPRMPSSP